MIWFRAICRTAAFVALAMAVAGCLPNRGAVSPDGRTFYFSLNKEAGFETKDDSNIYALDVETGRIKAITEGPQVKGWCSVSSDGKYLSYGTLAGTVAVVDLQEGNTLPLTGTTQNYAYPWVVPGEPPYILAMAQKSKDEMRWVLIGEHGDVPLASLADLKAGTGNVGLAPSQFAVPVYRAVKDGEKENVEASVWVVDLSNPPVAEGEEKGAAPPTGEAKPAEAAKAEGKAPASPAKPWPALACAAKWTDLKEGQPMIDLAFSPDGKRLGAAVWVVEKEPGQTRFFDVDPTGKEQPKLLFEVSGGYGPQWTPDASGLVYLRSVKDGGNGREVVLWRPDVKEGRVIARLPGDFGNAYTTCFWSKDGRMRIYHVANEGLWLVDAAADGTDAKARHLSRERLAAQKYLADFERGLGHVPGAPPENLSGPLGDALKAVGKPLQDAAKPTQDALKAAWVAASAWDEVPAEKHAPIKMGG
ncbi:MAG: hypothetical protein NTY65_03390 [Planctomycetota bacterium]|nr:hypothetical protein [Planctomycetota bacterium]